MALPSVSYTFTNGTTASGPQVSQNFADLVAALTDTTKSLSIDALTTAGAVSLGTTLAVAGASSLIGAVTLSSTLAVTGATTLSSTLAVTGATTLSSTLTVTGASTLTGAVACSSTLAVTSANVAVGLTAAAMAIAGSNTMSRYIYLKNATSAGVILEGAVTKFAIYSSSGGSLAFADETAGGVSRASISSTGEFRIVALAGTGTRTVVADADGDLSAPEQIKIRAYRGTSDQAIASSGTTVVNFNAESFDTGSDFDTATYTFTVPATGYYNLYTQVMMTNVSVSSTVKIEILKNATVIAIDLLNLSGAATQFMMRTGGLFSLTALDTIIVQVTNSDGSYDVNFGEDKTYLTVQWVGA